MTELDRIWAAAWAALRDGVARREAPARHVTLATQGLEGGGEARLVVLRGADETARHLTLYSDGAARKCAEIAREPRACLIAWLPEPMTQLRLHGTITARPGDLALWDDLPANARALYGGQPGPGAPLAAPQDWRADPDPARFVALECRLRALESLTLAPGGHRRAAFRAENGWKGTWIAP